MGSYSDCLRQYLNTLDMLYNQTKNSPKGNMKYGLINSKYTEKIKMNTLILVELSTL